MKCETGILEYDGYVPNENRIIFKLECDHPIGGSHYGRVYGKLFADVIARGELKPGMRALETSTGSAGISFAMMGRLLGYPCIVAVPKGVGEARIEAIEAEGAEVILTDGDYVNGFPEFLAKYRAENLDVCFLNHSMNEKAGENKITTAALEPIAHEIAMQVPEATDVIVGIGNGSSPYAIGRALAAMGSDIKTLVYEPFQSGVAFEMHKPGLYKKEYGIDIGTLPQHHVPGLSYKGISFPHIRLCFRKGLVDETWLVSDFETDRAYETYWRERGEVRFAPDSVPRWDNPEFEDLPYGRSTLCGLAVAMKKAEREHGKTYIVIAYDYREGRYGP